MPTRATYWIRKPATGIAVLLASALLIIYARAPLLFLRPRFWAEEGTIYFAYAFTHRWYEALLTPHGAYALFYTSAATLLATRCVPLLEAPLVTTLLAAAVQLLPVGLILLSRASIWSEARHRMAAVLIVLVAPISGDLWLTTTNSHFYLSLVAVIILLEDLTTVSRLRLVIYSGLLALAGLTGPVSCLLCPLFIWKAMRSRAPAELAQAAILLGCVAVQLLVVWSIRADPGLTRRLTLLDPFTLVSVLWTNTFVRPFFGLPLSDRCARFLFALRRSSPVQFGMLAFLLFALEAAWVAFLCAKIEPRARWILLGSYLLLAIVSAELSAGSSNDKASLLYPQYGGRYFFVPTVILTWMALLNVRAGAGAARATICGALALLCLLIGSSEYGPPPTPRGPDWPTEVRRWQENPDYQLRIWPHGWTISLRSPP